jgi:hypothetical protein
VGTGDERTLKARFRQLRERHGSKPSLMQRLDRAGLAK